MTSIKSSKWMSVFNSDHCCWTVNWGVEGGPPISLETVQKLTKAYFDRHQEATVSVPALDSISWICACHHSDKWHGLHRYHVDYQP